MYVGTDRWTAAVFLPRTIFGRIGSGITNLSDTGQKTTVKWDGSLTIIDFRTAYVSFGRLVIQHSH